MWAKGRSMYEEELMIPLLISDPRTMQDKMYYNDTLVSHIDVVPTICNMVGATHEEDLPGVDLMTSQPTTRTHIFVEGGCVTETRFKGLKTRDGWKYWRYDHTGEEVLFNLNEPNGHLEMNNLGSDIDYKALRKYFQDLIDHWYTGR